MGNSADYRNTLLVLHLSSVLRLWTIVRITFVQLTLLLHHCTILPIYDGIACTPTASFGLCHCMFLRIYVSTAHFAFTRLGDSTHLRCYCTPTVSFVLNHCTILRIYDAFVRRLSVLLSTTVRFYASTFLRLTLLHRLNLCSNVVTR